MNKPETNPVKRFFERRPPGMRAAVNAMCAQCAGCTSALQGSQFTDHIEPGFREVIGTCGITSCPLHTLRPYQSKSEAQL